MTNLLEYAFTPLESPQSIRDQHWPEEVVPLVSISSLVYNQKAYIVTCIESLLNQQTTFPVEIVLHDDASQDGTSDILKQYAAQFPRLIRLICQEENLFYSNIKKIEHDIHRLRRGKYIANCEGDDYWIDPLKLEKQVTFLEANPDFTGIHTQVQYIDKDNQVLGVSNKVPPGREEASFADVVTDSMIHSVSFLYRSDVLFLKDGFVWDYAPHYYDQYLFLATARCGKVKYLKEITSCYRINVGVFNTWNRFAKASFFVDCLNFYLSLDLKSNEKQACYLKLKQHYALIFCYQAKNRDSKAWLYFKKYWQNNGHLWHELPMASFIKEASKLEYDLVRGLFWYVIIGVSGGRVRPKGVKLSSL